MFLSCAPADVLRVGRIRKEISERGAVVFIDGEIKGPDPERKILKALHYADEVVVFVTPTIAKALERPQTLAGPERPGSVQALAFVEHRSLWMAFAFALSRGIPIRALVTEYSLPGFENNPEIPGIIRELALRSKLDDYLRELELAATVSGPTRTVRNRPPSDCKVCLCDSGHNAQLVNRIEKGLRGAGMTVEKWSSGFTLARVREFDALVVIGPKGLGGLKTCPCAEFIGASRALERPVVLLTLSKTQNTSDVRDWLPGVRVVAYRKGDEAVLRELTRSIVGYRDYSYDPSKSPGTRQRPAPRVFHPTVLRLDLVHSKRIVESLVAEFGSYEAGRRVEKEIRDLVDAGLKAVSVPRKQAVLDKNGGDEVMLVLNDANTAHRFASEFHRELRVRNRSKTDFLEKRFFRMGAASWRSHSQPLRRSRPEPPYPQKAAANRLGEAARPGELVVDRLTFDALKRTYQERYAGPEIVRDKHDVPYEVWRCVMDTGAAAECAAATLPPGPQQEPPTDSTPPTKKSPSSANTQVRRKTAGTD